MSKTLKGVDVSYANGTVNWATLKKAGVDFAIIRCGFGSENPQQVDKQFKANIQGCIDNGIKIGIYHFAYCVDTKAAQDEANFCLKLIEPYKEHITLPVFYDFEYDTLDYCTKQNITHTKSSVTACIKAFCDKVQTAGYTAGVYTNRDFIDNRLNLSQLSDYPLWIAAPNAKSPGLACDIWQYSWTGKFDGMSCDFDMNFCYTDYDEKTAPSKPQTIIDGQVNSSMTVDYSVTVTTKNGLNIRAGAALSYMAKGAIPCGETVKIARQTSGSGYTWGYTTYNGITGWIALEYTDKDAIRVGDKVKVKAGSTSYMSTIQLANWCYDTVFDVMELVRDRAVIGINGKVTSAVNVNNLKKYE